MGMRTGEVNLKDFLLTTDLLSVEPENSKCEMSTRNFVTLVVPILFILGALVGCTWLPSMTVRL